MSQEKNRHSGHKKRLRKKFDANNDFTGFMDHEILETMLNFVQVRKNMNNIAHDLIEKFGSFDAVFDADKEELMTVEGVGEVTASFITMQRHFFGEYLRRKYDINAKKNEDIDFHEHVKSLFAGSKKELFYMFCIGENGRLNQTHLVGRGSDDTVLLDQREIVKIALTSNSWGVIFAHNHITGIVTPSNDDVVSTKKLRESLATVGIKLIDHIIVAGGQSTSILDDNRYRLLK